MAYWVWWVILRSWSMGYVWESGRWDKTIGKPASQRIIGGISEIPFLQHYGQIGGKARRNVDISTTVQGEPNEGSSSGDKEEDVKNSCTIFSTHVQLLFSDVLRNFASSIFSSF